MKTKLFIAALATLAVVGCNKENENVSPQDGHTSLISVSLKAAGTMTKADDFNKFEYGDDEKNENTVMNAVFYFFDAQGNAYPLEDNINYVNVESSKLGMKDVEDSPTGSIESYSDVILVLKGQRNTPPAQMVALINVSPTTYNNKSLSELQEASTNFITTTANTDYFIMSNSVYKENQKVVTATQILPENIFTSPDSGIGAGDSYESSEVTGVTPVEIFVERVAAKVRVDVTADSQTVGSEKIYKVTDSDDTYVKVLGWDVTNATNTSHLIKKYATTSLFSTVDNPAFHRSYWAETHKDAVAQHGFTFEALKGENKKVVGDVAYYHENTLQTTAVADNWYNDVKKEGNSTTGILAPQLIVAAQLCDASGNAKEMGSWYGQTYANVSDLKTAMISNVAKQIFVESTTEANTKVGIGVNDVIFEQVADNTSYYDGSWNNGDYRYEVRVVANTSKTYYKADGETAYSIDEVNVILSKIEPARIWTSGFTYYYALINHFGDAKAMVRNHLYDVKITGFKGFGTPVYNPDKIITPEKPVDPEAYHLAAQINVLSWHVVANEVELGF